MKLIDLTCSSCGATMKINPQIKKCICNYCGKEMLVDDEIQKHELVNGFQYGYDLEKGRIAAQEEKKIAELRDQALAEREELIAKKHVKGIKALVWLIAFILMIVFCVMNENNFFLGFMAFIVFVCLVLAIKDYVSALISIPYEPTVTSTRGTTVKPGICPNCGTKNDEDDYYCQKCKMKLR